MFGVDTRGQSELYREPIKDENIYEKPPEKKPKFNPNDPSTFKHSQLYKKWQMDSDADGAMGTSVKKTGWIEFFSQPSPPQIWFKMWDDRDSPALIAAKLKK